MASSSPTPTLPITAGEAAVASGQASPASAFRIFLSRLSDSVRRSLAHRRPLSELLDRSALSRPESLSEATSRVRKNLAYFRVNYLAFLAVVLALSLLSHPFSLLVLLALLAAWCLLYLFRPSDPPLVVLGRTFSDRETLSALVVITVLVIFLTSVGSLLISALMVGFALVCAHGAFRVPEDLFLDEQDPAGATSGFLSLLGTAASTAGPAVAVRV